MLLFNYFQTKNKNFEIKGYLELLRSTFFIFAPRFFSQTVSAPRTLFKEKM
jgi:hypothetical protein